MRYLVPILLFSARPLLANDHVTTDIEWTFLVMGLFGGLSLFLYGMDKMSDGMKKAAGDRMRNILAALTRHRIVGLTLGAFVTMVIQSSSATTVMLVSFVQAGLMGFAQSLAVIMGANIGTTITAQLVAFKLTDYALAMITIGFLMNLFSKQESIKHLGQALLGFGILFFGMKLMSDSMKPLRTFEPFIGLMEGLENPIYGLLIGALFTGLIQSSSAFTGIVIVLAQQGLLSLDAGIPLIMGANIGTCITAGLASIGTIRGAKRVAIAHVLFNLGGVFIFIWFIPQLADLVRWMSPVAHATGVEKLAMETPRQIANAHTIFNITVGLVFLPFTSFLATLILKILPDEEIEKGIVPVTWHLDNSQVSHPAVAIELARTEMLRMIKILGRMLDVFLRPFLGDEKEPDRYYPQLSLMEGIDMREDKINFLEQNVSKYLFSISRQELSDIQAAKVFSMMSMVKDMESIGDIIHGRIKLLVEKKRKLKEPFSEQGQNELTDFHVRVMKQISRLRSAFSKEKSKKIEKVIRKDQKYRDLESEYRMRHLERVKSERADSVATHDLHMELMDLLKQINVYTGEIAKNIVVIEETETE
ncbi:MAG: Na/Pi cotransporter family protein [FCB group bacterium]|nr:Na/Pi cotransporter family protein [FCB group bacterium]MBL7027577.1 Na/Pi cotransporter family protein [Candidatus Neomarinimicrobiota bacterium]MBL7121207.1 Na/Pi cotransporter family protein [Candidatus Neomarinimicrobiota bacterium]